MHVITFFLIQLEFQSEKDAGLKQRARDKNSK